MMMMVQSTKSFYFIPLRLLAFLFLRDCECWREESHFVLVVREERAEG